MCTDIMSLTISILTNGDVLWAQQKNLDSLKGWEFHNRPRERRLLTKKKVFWSTGLALVKLRLEQLHLHTAYDRSYCWLDLMCQIHNCHCFNEKYVRMATLRVAHNTTHPSLFWAGPYLRMGHRAANFHGWHIKKKSRLKYVMRKKKAVHEREI
jgi:hypothetical protein